MTGHHERIRRWRLERKIEKTMTMRPDLIQRGRENGIFNREIISIIDRLENDSGSDIEGEKDERD